jgi:ubiquinone biosynthesis protein
MLNPGLIPTPLIEASARQAVPIAIPEKPRRSRPLFALFRFFSFFLTMLCLRVTGRRTPEVTAQRLRTLLEELGGLWVKAGQLLSLRVDLLSEPVCRELSKLQYRAIGFPPELARTIIETELGCPLEQVFASFDDLPFAAASISQVHRAVLHRKQVPVVVKVQRPNVHQIFQRDLVLLQWLVRLLLRLQILPYMRLPDALWELEQIVQEETDYRYEASNLRRMKKVLKPHKIYIPKVFMKYCTDKLLVMEYIDGVLMSDFIAMKEQDPLRLTAWLYTNNIQPKRVGTRLFLSAMRQLFEDNLFHADLHPGNIVLLRHSRIALIDLGTIGVVPRQVLQVYMRGMSALATGDFEKAVDYTLHLATDLPLLSLTELREQLVRSYREWEARTHLAQLSYHEKSLAAAGAATGKILAAYKVQLSWVFMKISRTWMTLDASLNYLIPNADYMKLFQKYGRQAERRARTWANVYRRMRETARTVSDTLHEYNLLLAPLIRRQTLVFQGVRSKIALAFALIARAFSLGIAMLATYLIFAFLHQHHPSLAKPITRVDRIREIIEDVPPIEYLYWVAILVGVFAAYRLGIQLIKVLESPEEKK